jgi:hypothetical protein
MPPELRIQVTEVVMDASASGSGVGIWSWRIVDQRGQERGRGSASTREEAERVARRFLEALERNPDAWERP